VKLCSWPYVAADTLCCLIKLGDHAKATDILLLTC